MPERKDYCIDMIDKHLGGLFCCCKAFRKSNDFVNGGK